MRILCNDRFPEQVTTSDGKYIFTLWNDFGLSGHMVYSLSLAPGRWNTESPTDYTYKEAKFNVPLRNSINPSDVQSILSTLMKNIKRVYVAGHGVYLIYPDCRLSGEILLAYKGILINSTVENAVLVRTSLSNCEVLRANCFDVEASNCMISRPMNTAFTSFSDLIESLYKKYDSYKLFLGNCNTKSIYVGQVDYGNLTLKNCDIFDTYLTTQSGVNGMVVESTPFSYFTAMSTVKKSAISLNDFLVWLRDFEGTLSSDFKWSSDWWHFLVEDSIKFIWFDYRKDAAGNRNLVKKLFGASDPTIPGSECVGFELEVECGINPTLPSDQDRFTRRFLSCWYGIDVRDVTKEHYGQWITNVGELCLDGSIKTGVEIVLHAKPVKKMNGLLAKLIATLKSVQNKFGYKIAANDDSTGCHIHITTPGFFRDEHLEMMRKIMYNSKGTPAYKGWFRFSMRNSESSLDSYGDIAGKYGYSNMSERYQGINWTKYTGRNGPGKSIEFRIFQGGYRSEVRIMTEGWVTACRGLIHFVASHYHELEETANSVDLNTSPNPLMAMWLEYMRVEFPQFFGSHSKAKHLSANKHKYVIIAGIKFPHGTSVGQIFEALNT